MILPGKITRLHILDLGLFDVREGERIIGIPAGLMKIAGFFAEFLPVPPLSHDQVELLTHDNVARPGAPGLAALGIQATAAEYRKLGKQMPSALSVGTEF